LSAIQGDAIRNITGELYFNRGGYDYEQYIGAFSLTEDISSIGDGENWDHMMGHLRFDSSRVIPTANENRPINIAVRYLMRALP
jgi:hypothetical protein